jgi:hypothetical protein
MTNLAEVPRFDQLPKLANGLRCSWSVFGDADNLGSANFLTEDAVLLAAAEILHGQRVNLTLNLTLPSPPYFGRRPYSHTVYQHGPDVYDDVIDAFYPQSSSQWDGLRHRQDGEYGFYGGLSLDELKSDDSRLGIDAWARRGIVGRGILVDVERYLYDRNQNYDPTANFEIGPDLLADVLSAQGSEHLPGDIMLLRTGYMGAYLRADEAGRAALASDVASAGLSATEEMAEYLWNGQFSAVAADNPGVEALPLASTSECYLHARLIPMLGFAMGEFLDFEELGRLSAADGRFTSMFVSVPLNMPAALGSPANAIAIR